METTNRTELRYKRRLKSFVESALNVRIVRPHVVAPLFEEFHLRQALPP